MSKLVIISHTNHQIHEDGYPVGWAPTINEINYLAHFFDEIVHIACLSNTKPSGSSIPYSDSKIKFVPIPTFGGSSMASKFNTIKIAPKIINIVNASITDATHVQLRLPMGIGVFLLPFFSIYNDRNFLLWVKYANDWGQLRPPLGYSFQRWFLKQNYARCKVTINGSWPDQPSHCVSFENPCLSDMSRYEGLEAIPKKIMARPYRFVFAGRVEHEKGILRCIDAVMKLNPDLVERFDILGDGKDLDLAMRMAEPLGSIVTFHGFATQEKVHSFLKDGHFLLLPTTASEGFPKVVAEALNYGCLPIITKAGSIPHYIKNGFNGFLLDSPESDGIVAVVNDMSTLSEDIITTIKYEGYKTAGMFTYNAYYHKLQKFIFAV